MTSTDDLIHSLASTAGTRRSASPGAVLAVTAAASLACALVLVISVLGIRHDLADLAVRVPFAFKVAYTGALVIGALAVALKAATPGTSVTAFYAFLPAIALLILGIILDPTGLPIMGRTNTAAALCVGRILFVSLPATFLIFAFMRKAAPTQPLFAGAAIGMLSASVGALAYTLACRNDGTAFVAIWYTVACAIMAVIGAFAGSRFLRW